MKKYFIVFSILFLFGCNDRDSDDIASEVNYYFSSNDSFCAPIFYDVKNAPPLTIKDNVIDYHFDHQNLLTTSSSYDFGWKSKENSGFRTTNYYKEDGSRINENEITSVNGSYTLEDIEYHYDIFQYKGQEECFSSEEDSLLLQNLIEKIYKKNN